MSHSTTPGVDYSLSPPPWGRRSPWRRVIGRLGLMLVTLFWLGGAVAADTPQNITRVEEDWYIRINTPSPEGDAPQITIVTSPTGHLDDAYGVLEINHIPVPEFTSGGLQLQTWVGDTNFGSTFVGGNVSLATSGEEINFTMRMSLSSGFLRFRVRNGTSQTWGAFGAPGTMSLSRYSNLENLNAYSPEKSAEFSRVSFAGNRVSRLILKSVRYYSGSTLVATDNTERVVHTYDGGE